MARAGLVRRVRDGKGQPYRETNRLRLALIVAACALGISFSAQEGPRRRSAIIFVTDGLRAGSVNAIDTPALWHVRTEGVNFANSHSLFPTLTMPNASAIATGHYIGDTGQFANYMFMGYPIFYTGNFGRPAGSMTPFTESVEVLGDLSDHTGGNPLREASLLAYARSYGYNTAALGKLGPAAVQDVTELEPLRGAFRVPTTILVDYETGLKSGVPLSETTLKMLAAAGLATSPPPRNQPPGTNTTPGTLTPNVASQQWFADVITRAILPRFYASDEPFVLIYWSGDPDQTQHAQGDSLNVLSPGVNGPTSKAGVRNADSNLKQILDYVNADPDRHDSTNIFVTADHGFSTVSRHEIDAAGGTARGYSTTFRYKDANGRQEVNDGYLPTGFLPIDLAHELGLPLYDPSTVISENGISVYAPVDPTIGQQTATVRQRPANSSGLIGGRGWVGRPADAKVVVAESSIYVPDSDRDTVQRIVRFLTNQDYVGGIFLNDRFGEMPGALAMSSVALMGGATALKPAVVVNFKSFITDKSNPNMTGVMLWGATYQHGQGHHGSLSRANTFNNMAAIGPDFKRRFVDRAPISNADVQPTLAHVLGMRMPSLGRLRGRVIMEALAGRSDNPRYQSRVARSRPAATGVSTVLMYQQLGNYLYFDEACFTKGARCDE